MPDVILPARVLIVDDDEQVLKVHGRALSNAGFAVQTAVDGDAAMAALDSASFDVILSDIDMPGMNGIELLEHVRARDVDVPVILVTGAPAVETAIQAVDRGALRYVPKPVGLAELVELTTDAVRLHKIAIAKRQALSLLGDPGRFSGDQTALNLSFDRALASVHLLYQPIVSWSSRSVYGWEALLRSHEPGLTSPQSLVDAAERLARHSDLGRRARARAIEPIDRLPPGQLLFLNLHPSNLIDDSLLDEQGPLGGVASRIVLEVTERAPLEGIRGVRGRIEALRAMGFRFALDDFGAGYGGLTSFALVEPEIVKLDMSLIGGMEREPMKLSIVRTMIQLCRDLGIVVLAEGVETVEERDELLRAGCDLFQGYLFARPGRPFPTPEF